MDSNEHYYVNMQASSKFVQWYNIFSLILSNLQNISNLLLHSCFIRDLTLSFWTIWYQQDWDWVSLDSLLLGHYTY